MTRNRSFIACSVALAATPVLPVSALADRTDPAEGTELYFISPQDGDTVVSPIHVRMGLRGTHTLQLLFMDYRHISFDPPVVSEQITITVE
ncbi:DUF4399 domain-containing protein [Thioalkalivibrio sp. ALJ24]|uniref:DUF4399 domain-containing protein n=1 Tax=Thioalkalivibrio sp. ALJ24 TaxID=545276 RepID=UPI00036E7563|nr:DUF4399 domain-containing protein [Thioalkalivibrio sp. ALJ24]